MFGEHVNVNAQDEHTPMVSNLRGVVAFARLHDEPLLFRGEVDAVITAGGWRVRGVSEAVLVPQVLLDSREDLIDRHTLRYFEELGARVSGELLHDLFAVRTVHTAATPSHASEAAEVHRGVPEQDGIDKRVGALCRFDGA